MSIDDAARPPSSPRRERNRLIVLVGPKGSGKTTIGRMLEQRLGARFIAVEAVAKRVLAEMGNVVDERYARRAFEEIVRELEQAARAHAVMVIESTGASSETAAFFAALRERFDVRFVRVRATRDTCADRIETRDQSAQIQVSRELVEQMYERTAALELAWDLELDNERPLSAEEVTSACAPLVG